MNMYPERKLRCQRNPTFVVPDHNVKKPLTSLPDKIRYSPDHLDDTIKPVYDMGVDGILIFGILPDNNKTEDGRAAWGPAGPASEALRCMCNPFPSQALFTDACLQAAHTAFRSVAAASKNYCRVKKSI